MSETILWDYPNSSASYRLRIALNMTGEPYRIETVNLQEKAHRRADHLARNPQGLVPVLDIDGHRFTQSLAILDYLDSTRNLGLLPKDPVARTKAQALAQSIAIDLHPVCNLSVMAHATGGLEPARTNWMQHFIAPGLRAFEALMADFKQTPYTTGAAVGLADICLMPQLYNANRWGVDYTDCIGIKAVEAACSEHPAFQAAFPD